VSALAQQINLLQFLEAKREQLKASYSDTYCVFQQLDVLATLLPGANFLYVKELLQINKIRKSQD
jgi:hypothetical protein